MSPLGAVSRTARRGLVVLTAAVLGVVAGAVPAHADPTISEIEAQINSTWSKLEPLIEEYNKVHSELRKLESQAKSLDKKLAPLAAQVRITQGRVGYIASSYYKSGRSSTFNALVSAQTPTQFSDQLMMLDYMARQERHRIDETLKLKATYDAKNTELEKNLEAQRARDSELKAKKKTIEAQLSDLQQLRIQAYGSNPTESGSLKIGNACPVIAIGGPGQIAAEFACKQIGKPYVWATNGPNTYDCSGLTQAAWKAAGVSLTHYTGAQWNEGIRVSRANAQTGDLVFFGSNLHHVGLYVGNGIMVHAPNSTTVVKMSYIDSFGEYIAGFVRPQK